MRAAKSRSAIDVLLPSLAKVTRDRRGLPELASALIQLRSRTGKTQAQLAELAGVSQTLISELENVRNDGVAWRTVMRLAEGAGAAVSVRFSLAPAHAGDVSVDVEGEYASSDIDIDEVTALIDARNHGDDSLGHLAA